MQLPTPDVVRRVIGDTFAPQTTYAVAALVLQVDGVRREAWSDETELAARLFENYPRDAVPPPEIGKEPRSHKRIDDAVPTQTRRCSTCIIRPGFEPCGLCVGTGAGPGDLPRCTGCNGDGFLPCTVCEGSTRVVACAVRYVNDEPVVIRRTIVPALDASIRPFLEARIDPQASWPADHAFDPEPALVASAYRGAGTVRAVEDIQGFYFGDAVAACLTARTEATTGLARFDARVYAIPVLWTITRHQHRAYFFDSAGELHVVGS